MRLFKLEWVRISHLLGCAGNGGAKAAGRFYGIKAKSDTTVLQIKAVENRHLEKWMRFEGVNLGEK